MFVFVLLVALWGCDRRDAENRSAEGASSALSADSESAPDGKGTTRSPRVDAPPSAAGAMAPNLYPRPDGVGLSWLEPVPPASREPGAPDDPMQMRHAVLTDGSWSKPQTVVANVEFFANWADVPSVARATNGTLYAHWPQKSAADTYAYDVVLARSEDDGGTWATLGAPHDDGTPTEHGFAKMILGDSGVRLVWLDGRQMADDPPGPMTLRSAVAGEKFGEPALLDARVCDCCATDAVAIEDGAIVVYRDRGEDEVRDIAVQRLAGGEWHSTTPVHAKADGKTLVVNLWATWCEPCRRELPLLDELQRERTDVHVVAISVDAAQDEEAVRDWVKGHRPKLQVLLDPENRASRIFGVDALPATFVFGPDDRLTWFKRGAVEHDELIDAL